MKKIVGTLLVFGMTMLVSFVAAAHAGESIDFEKKVTVELDSMEEFRNYPRNPNYRYRFLIRILNKSRGMCWNCGTQTLETYLEVDHIDRDNFLPCPNNPDRWNDTFSTFENYNLQKCTRCGIVESREYIGLTYESFCANVGELFEVREEWGPGSGLDMHYWYSYWQSVI